MTAVTKHGYGGYVMGCRCDICVGDKRVYGRNYMAAWRARKRWAEQHGKVGA